MNKPMSLPLPKCIKCKKTLEPEFTTEKEEGDNSKPKILMMFGRCEDCKIITMCNLIKTKDIPTEVDLVRSSKLSRNNSQQEKCGDSPTRQHRSGTHPEEGKVSKETDRATADNIRQIKSKGIKK